MLQLEKAHVQQLRPNTAKTKKVIIIIIIKFRGKKLKAAREKQQIIYTGNEVISLFFSKTLQARREWQDIF